MPPHLYEKLVRVYRERQLQHAAEDEMAGGVKACRSVE
jgi:hypothetical protein